MYLGQVNLKVRKNRGTFDQLFGWNHETECSPSLRELVINAYMTRIQNITVHQYLL